MFLGILLIGGCPTIAIANTNVNFITAKQLSKKITISMKNSSVRAIIYEIQRQSNLNIIIQGDGIDKLPKRNFSVKDDSIEQTLTQLLTGTNYTFKINEKHISISEKSSSPETKQTGNQQSKITVKGKVLDGNKKPITGATVLVLGTSVGAITDDMGFYSIPVTIGQTIEISFVGMKTLLKKIEVAINELNVSLEHDQMDIDNVIVTGQANISRNSFTGNAKTIKGEDLLKVSRTNVIKAIQSFDPSFRIADNMMFGSDPNSLPEVNLRGRSSLGSYELDTDALSKNNLKNNPNTPTFIMDGFEVDIQKVYDLDPNRILSMTILKDAAATAMYGSRAANGVVVITTTPAKEGRIKISYNLTTTVEAPDLSDYNLMNAAEKLDIEKKAGIYTNSDGFFDGTSAVKYWDRWNTVYVEKVDTDWMSQPLRTAFKHKHSLTLEGGSSEIRYGLNMKYTGDDGVMKGSDRNNTGAELYLQFNFGKLNIRNTTSFGTTWSNESPYGRFSEYTHKLPYNRIRDKQGNLLKTLEYGDLNSTTNPIYEASLYSFEKSSYDEFLNNLDLKWNVNEYLRVTGQISYTKRWDKSNRFIDPLSQNSSQKITSTSMETGDLYSKTGGSNKLSTRIGLSYNRNIEKNSINLTVNGELLQDKDNGLSIHYVGFATGSQSSVNYATRVYDKPLSSESTSRSVGVTGIFNYSYDDTYLADVSFRYEGSSMFGSNQRATPFWSGGIGVNIHKYEFLKNSPVISRLKIRGSYGQLGNINFPSYAAENFYQSITNDWYATGFGTRLEYLGNPDLRVEKTHVLDVGIDLSLFNDRLTIVASYYNKKTMDMINDVTIPSSSGFKIYKENFGKVANTGYEIDIYANVVQSRNFSLTLNANLASNKNKLLETGESMKNYNDRVDEYFAESDVHKQMQEYSKPLRKFEEGGSLTAIYGMQSIGINPQTGQEMFKDRYGNIVNKWVSSQQHILGDTEPAAQGSFGLNARYKNFTLYASFYYEFGGQIYNQTLVDYVENADIENSNVDKRVASQRWQNIGDVAPLKDIKDRTTTKSSSRFVQDNNVVSLKSLSLQYEFSDKIAKSMLLERLRLEASCNDLLRISSVKQERGLSYPFARTFNFSLMVNF